MAVNNGRIASIERASAKDCGKDGGGDKALAGIAAGAVAIGLIAALSSHHDRDDHRDNNAGYNAEYERGYNDAMYGAHYSNRDSEAYHSGYIAGETERNNRRHANSSVARSLPGAAGNACISRGEYEWGVYPGSVSVVSSRQNGGGEWEATLATGNWRARCRVTADGGDGLPGSLTVSETPRLGETLVWLQGTRPRSAFPQPHHAFQGR